MNILKRYHDLKTELDQTQRRISALRSKILKQIENDDDFDTDYFSAIVEMVNRVTYDRYMLRDKFGDDIDDCAKTTTYKKLKVRAL